MVIGRARDRAALPVSPLWAADSLFEVPRAVPTMGLPLQSRRRVPHDAIERGQEAA
jgi:hypothetical protein